MNQIKDDGLMDVLGMKEKENNEHVFFSQQKIKKDQQEIQIPFYRQIILQRKHGKITSKAESNIIKAIVFAKKSNFDVKNENRL